MRTPVSRLVGVSEHVKACVGDAGYAYCEELVALDADAAAALAQTSRLPFNALQHCISEARLLAAAHDTQATVSGGRGNSQGAVANSDHDDDDDDDDDVAATQLCLPLGESALALLEKETTADVTSFVPTFSRGLDELLGGGFRLGTVSEVCGLPGAGKTQLCSQLAVATRLPAGFGGVDGKTLIVDTEGSFVPARLRDMAAAAAAHVQFVCHQQATQVDAAAANTFAEVAAAYTVDAIMESVLVHRTHDVAELMATVVALPDLLATRVDIRTVIIDSVAFPLRGAVPISAGEAAAHYGGGASGSGAGWEAHARRTRLAMSISRKLHGVAENYNVAVIATNHMTPSAASFGSDAPTTYTSTLGDEWSHSIARRVLLSAKASHTMRTASVTSNAQVREAFLLKWPDSAEASFGATAPSAAFVISSRGIRDAEGSNPAAPTS